MKFAKQLQDELRQEWCDQYMDYKLMKKTLKIEDPDAAQRFLGVLQSQLAKVSVFMYGQKELISEGTTPIELGISSTNRDPRGHGGDTQETSDSKVDTDLPNHCMGLVDSIAAFREYAELNHVAFRKIVKKFDKRFQVSCLQDTDVAKPRPDDSWLSVADINAWMLTPAQRCMRIMHDATCAWPLAGRQLQFWTQELRAGCRYADARLKGWPEGEKGTSHFLSLRGPNQLCVKNTFLEPYSEGAEKEDQRAVAMSKQKSRSHPDLMMLAGATCYDDEQASNHSGETSNSNGAESLEGRSAECLAADISSETPPPLHPAVAAYNAAAAAQAAVAAVAAICPENCMMMMMAFNPAAAWPTMPYSNHKQKGRYAQADADESGPWWAQLTDACPLTGFPLCLLPYPPFKLRTPEGGRTRLVDGLHLALLVLSTWNFEVGGRRLTPGDIDALDTYIKKCKLGPASFRVKRAIQLKSSGTSADLQEFEDIRTRARRRLQEVQHKQRLRKTRETAVVAACEAAAGVAANTAGAPTVSMPPPGTINKASQRFGEDTVRGRARGNSMAGSKNGNRYNFTAAASFGASDASSSVWPMPMMATGRVSGGAPS
eukprot:TRINITY_DN13879_c0_g2_i3.p1 TRINITY_DN13879_c0_g2~~TRINITY_DN13879_c0_g2_i3.p1  ORF type:complete len:601 (-),score=110.52 TRINITY_DN13879_c0_g2_i3:504-2306(-)